MSDYETGRMIGACIEMAKEHISSAEVLMEIESRNVWGLFNDALLNLTFAHLTAQGTSFNIPQEGGAIPITSYADALADENPLKELILSLSDTYEINSSLMSPGPDGTLVEHPSSKKENDYFKKIDTAINQSLVWFELAGESFLVARNTEPFTTNAYKF